MCSAAVMLRWVQCCHACLPTAHRAVNRSLYVALEMQEKWKNLELSAKSRSLKPLELSPKWIQKLMLHALSSHAPCNFSTHNNKSLSMYFNRHLQCFLLFLCSDCFTQRLPIMPNFLLVTNTSHVKIALNRLSFFWPVPKG